jgi:astacin
LNFKGHKYLIPKKSELAVYLLLGFTSLPVISGEATTTVLDEILIDGSEQFNPDGIVTGRDWASLYRSSDNTSQLLPYTVVDGMAIHEGDIVLGRASDLEGSPASADSSIQQGVATSYLGHRWMDGNIPYVIRNGDYDAGQITSIMAGIDHLAANTSITLVPRTTETDYVEVISDTGCYSYIGQIGGKQTISLAPGCLSLGTVVHEFFHALGVYHEQSRSDRDSFVTINFQNITSGREGNFQIAGNSDDIGSYNYSSLMHYGRGAFSKNGQDTITVLGSATIGQRSGLSSGDIDTIQHIYYTDLELDLTTVSQANLGESVQAAINITNQGDSTIGNIIAKEVKISLPIPSQSTYTSFSSSDNWACQQVSQNVECIIDTLDRSSSSTVNINLTAPTSLTSMQLNPTVSSSNRDISPANNTKSETIAIANLPDVSISMSLSKTALQPADDFAATLNLSNSSQADAQQVSVAITKVSQVAFNGFSGSGWSCSNASNTTTCLLASLAKSASTTLVLNYTASSPLNSLSISSVVSTQNADSNTSNNTSSKTLRISDPASPTASSTSSGGGGGGGGVINLTTLFFLLLLLPPTMSIKRTRSRVQ